MGNRGVSSRVGMLSEKGNEIQYVYFEDDRAILVDCERRDLLI